MPIRRRELLESIAKAGMLGLAMPVVRAQEKVAQAVRGLRSPRIKDVSVIECAPAESRLTVVKITTDQVGWKGMAAGPFRHRANLVSPAVSGFLKPLLWA